MRTFIAALKLSVYGLWCALMIPPQIVVLLCTRGRGACVLPRLFHQVTCRIFSLECRMEGVPLRDHVVYVGNHLSYLDIPAMGTKFYGSFIAKDEVAGWFLFGYLAKLSQSLFISRDRLKAAETREMFSEVLREGRPLVLFGEGTSSNGSEVLPFKSSLFDALLNTETGISLQPFTLSVIEVDGRPVNGPADRDIYCWYGDMTLKPHIWQFAKSRGAKVVLAFHAPRRAAAYDNRKDLARDCHADCANHLIVPERTVLPVDFTGKAA